MNDIKSKEVLFEYSASREFIKMSTEYVTKVSENRSMTRLRMYDAVKAFITLGYVMEYRRKAGDMADAIEKNGTSYHYEVRLRFTGGSASSGMIDIEFPRPIPVLGSEDNDPLMVMFVPTSRWLRLFKELGFTVSDHMPEVEGLTWPVG